MEAKSAVEVVRFVEEFDTFSTPRPHDHDHDGGPSAQEQSNPDAPCPGLTVASGPVPDRSRDPRHVARPPPHDRGRHQDPGEPEESEISQNATFRLLRRSTVAADRRPHPRTGCERSLGPRPHLRRNPSLLLHTVGCRRVEAWWALMVDRTGTHALRRRPWSAPHDRSGST